MSWPGSGRLNRTDTATVIVAFNSGFRLADSNGGFALGSRGFASLQPRS